MQPTRPSDSSATLRSQSRRQRATPSAEHGHHAGLHQSQTSLPSIRQLHPYLPPSGMSQHSQAGEGSNFTYPPPSAYNHPNPSDSLSMSRPIIRETFGADSDAEGDTDQRGPPKKKRRRQALSCTECKRRKIKCDRAQPCGPCARRGEQSKCQWHIVEPIEKYVTRAEYDELKARFDHLESTVSQIFAATPGTLGVPPYHMAMHSGMPGTGSIQSYHAGPPAQVVYHHTMMAPSGFQHLDTSPGASQGPPRYPKPESPPRHQQPVNMPPPSSSTVPTGPIAGPSTSRPRGSQDRRASTSKQYSPLSLASITSPFNPDPQSKNYHAQTLTLGERLRPGCQAHEDSAIPFNKGRWARTHRRRPRTHLTYSLMTRLRPRRSRCPRSRLAVLATLPFFCPAPDQHGMTIEII